MAFGPSSDRPIGMRSALGTFLYEERFAVFTREKLDALNVGQGVTVAMPCNEAAEIFLGGEFMLYLRVQRVQ